MAILNFGTFPPKAAGEKKDYSFVWTEELQKDGDTITSSAWAIEAGVTINTTDKPKTNDDQTTTVWLNAGSTVGTYSLVNTINTTAGRIHVATATLKVVA